MVVSEESSFEPKMTRESIFLQERQRRNAKYILFYPDLSVDGRIRSKVNLMMILLGEFASTV